MLSIVLVEPKGEENIGAVSRSMMNFGLDRLLLVNPQCDHLSEKSLNYAIHSSDILRRALLFNDLNEVVSNSSLSIAVTRRVGDWRKRDFYSPQIASFLSGYKDTAVNLVFGREANGLTNEEIKLCDVICSIPSSDDFPSLNLSHSVTIILYELFKDKYLDKNDNIAKIEDFNAATGQIYEALENMDFFKNKASWVMKNFIKKILLRARLKEDETRIIKNVFKSIDGIVNKNQRV